jgi:hypothetical protein
MAQVSTINWGATADYPDNVVNYTLTGVAETIPFNPEYLTQKTIFHPISLIQNPIYFSNPPSNRPVGEGTPAPFYQMPDFYNRSLVITCSTEIDAADLTITGVDTLSNVVNYTNAGVINAATPTDTGLLFYKITSITFNALGNVGNLTIGLGNNGQTGTYIADKWNKNNNYTISYQADAAISVTPNYITQDIVTFTSGQPVYTASPTLYEFPLTNTNAVFISPTTIVAYPITESAALSVTGIPLTGITTVVNTDEAFTQTIAQQGGRF